MNIMHVNARLMAAGCAAVGLLLAAVPATADPTAPGGDSFCGLAGAVANRTGFTYPPQCEIDPDAPAPETTSLNHAGSTAYRAPLGTSEDRPAVEKHVASVAATLHQDAFAPADAGSMIDFVAMMTGFRSTS